MPTTEPMRWLIPSSIYVGVLCGYAVRHWFSASKRRTRVQRLREQVERLGQRIAEATTTERAQRSSRLEQAAHTSSLEVYV